MDQERDTTDHSQSSRRGRFWREYGPTASSGHTSPAGHGEETGHSPASEPARQPSDWQPSSAENRRECADDALPTLFELPDRTPEALKRNRQSGQFTIHTPHAGPPASHVDPPSGNHSHLDFKGPPPPGSFDSATPNALESPEATNQDLGQRTKDAGDHPQTVEKIAAYNDESTPSWAENSKASWATRSAIVMLVLMMVTLAFFSGRGLNRIGDGTAAKSLTDADVNRSGETVVMITDDYQIIDDTSDHDALETSQMTATVADTTRHTDSPNQEYASDVADSQLPAGTLGVPSATTNESLVMQDDAQSLDEPFQNDVPPIISSNEAVVAFRANDTPDANGVDTTDDLPSGMDSRLRLHDGLRYSDTPHAIGNFLEILKAWEKSLVQ